MVLWTARRSNHSILKEINLNIHWDDWNAAVEAPILWPPDVKSWLTGKDPDAGKDWREKQRMRWLDSIADSMDMNLSKHLEKVEDRGAWCAGVHDIEKSWTRLSYWTRMYSYMFMTSRNSAEQLTLLCPRPLPQLAGPCFQDYFRPSSWTLPLKTKTKHFHPCHLFFPFFLFMLSHSVVSDSLQPYGLYSPPVSSVHGISQAKILGVNCHFCPRGSSPPRDQSSISCLAVQFLSCVWFFATPWTAAHQASLFITNSTVQKHQFFGAQCLAGRFFTTEPPGSPSTLPSRYL